MSSIGSLHFRKLSDDKLERIHAASLEILERTGMRMHEPRVLDLLQKHGASVDDGNRVRIPRALVEWALSVAPKSTTLYKRNGDAGMVLEGHNMYFGTGSDCPNVIDFRTGERRPGTLQDIVEATRICDSLPNIDFLMSFCIANDLDPLTYDRHQMRAMLMNSSKPILFVTLDFDGCVDAIRMAEAVAGGAEALKSRPLCACYINVSNALQHNREALQKLYFLAEKGLPATYTPVVLRGATGPVTAAGAIALANAGELAGLVVAQLVREGTPVILTGGVNDMLEMRTAIDCYSDPTNRVMLVELAHRYGLPIFGLTGCSDSKLPDQQAAAEAALSILLESLAGAQMAHDVGYLDSGMTNSVEQVVICDEIIGYTKHFMSDLEVSDETLALDLIDQIGPDGDFMGSQHTRKHFREDWYPQLFERRNYDGWLKAGGKTLRERAQEKALSILERHKPEPLAVEVQQEIDAIVAQAGAAIRTGSR
ncbi:MAG TPA: trimethylamine methyltransferase family protein [Anaerolineales bacterium]|nr:trimethylamine methyltransferase family protein [Anaerolineales bacterium]